MGKDKLSKEMKIEIINFIAAQHEDYAEYDRSFWDDDDRREKLRRIRDKNLEVKEWKKNAEICFQKLIKNYSRGHHYNELDKKFYPFDPKLSMDNLDHPVRRLQEIYLLIKLDITKCSSRAENWANIGKALANAESGLITILNPPKMEKRGRPKNGFLDYERAAWKCLLDEYAMQTAIPDDNGIFKAKIYSLTEILEAFDYGFKNPVEHSHIKILRQIDSKIKLRGRSRDSLLVAFNRGEKEREERWGG